MRRTQGRVQEGTAVKEAVAPHPAAKRVLGIGGSLRRGSYNRLLLEAVVDCASPWMVVEIYEELASIPLFDEDLEQMTGSGPDVVRRLRRQVASSQGLLIATPEYNHSMPGVLKNAIDWLSRSGPDEVLAGKPVALIGASAGQWGTRLAQSALRQVLFATESLVMVRPTLFVREAGGTFDEAGRLVDPSIRERLSAFLTAFADWIDLVAPDRDKITSGKPVG